MGDPARHICRRAFDLGVTHCDLAKQLRTSPYGAAESNFGRILATDFAAHRDELLISQRPVTTCGRVHGDLRIASTCSRYSINRSTRMGLDYVTSSTPTAPTRYAE